MLTSNDMKERLHRAYVTAVAGKAGVSIGEPQPDYGIDGTFRKIVIRGTRHFPSGCSLDYQLKSSSNWKRNNKDLLCDLESKTFNDLVSRRIEGSEKAACTPCILLLFFLPKDEDEWMNLTEEELILKRCCYWYHVIDSVETDNKIAKRIRVPRQQVFTPQALAELLIKVGNGELQ
jgi:hypothetical protein